MTHWQTNLGGAISVLGTSLIGVGVLAQASQLSPNSAFILDSDQLALMWYVALAGFILSAVGKGLTALFAADARTVNNVAAEVDRVNKEGPSPFAQPAVENKPAGDGGEGAAATNQTKQN
jgi:hypothetical protein